MHGSAHSWLLRRPVERLSALLKSTSSAVTAGKGESYSFAFRRQISPARVDYSASLEQLLSAALLACDHVRSYTNTDIPEPLEVPLSSSTRSTGIYDPVLIKQSLLVIKPPRWVLLEVHFKPLSPSVSLKVMSEE